MVMPFLFCPLVSFISSISPPGRWCVICLSAVIDVLTDGELSNPERLLASALDVIGKRNVVQ
jgi:hypothetical protein